MKPSAASNAACLTATGNTTTGVLRSCVAVNDATTPQPVPPILTVTDAPGSGTLALTQYQTGKAGGVFAATSVPTSQGLDVTLDLYQYGAASFPAYGIAFALSAVDPANPTAPPTWARPAVAGLFDARNAGRPGERIPRHRVRRLREIQRQTVPGC